MIGIILATFFLDFSHEMCKAVLPFYLTAVGFGPASLGINEGIADFLASLSKLGGGVVGHSGTTFWPMPSNRRTTSQPCQRRGNLG